MNTTPIEAIRKLADMAPSAAQEREAHRANGASTSSTGGHSTTNGYGKKALADEIAKLCAAPIGGRNNQLFRSAAALFELVAGGDLDGHEVESEMERTAIAIGLGSGEIQATIRSGREAGMKNPRTGTRPPNNVYSDGPPEVAAERKNGAPQAGSTAESVHPHQDRQTRFTGSELLTMVLPEPKWAIPGLMPEGLSILGGKPKMGKSWMALGMSVAVATGGVVLGNIQVGQGDVLYLALEDNPRRLQSRLKKVLSLDDGDADGEPVCLDNLTLETEWPRLDQGGLTKLRGWLAKHPNARLVILDTWARIKPRQRTNGSAYDEDYCSVEGLQRLANEVGVAILIITHLRKMDADDPLDTLNATLGFSGGADSILILKRERGRHDANLFVSGRDVEEQDLALKWDADIATWSIIGEAEEYRQSKARQEIVGVLSKAGTPMAPKDVAELLGKHPGAVRKLMWEMSKDSLLTPEGGSYSISRSK